MIYVTGDIHGEIDRFNENFKEQQFLTKDDYLIVCGDFGLLWNNSEEEKQLRRTLEEKNFTTLFIDGNHENFNILNNYKVEIWNGGKIHKISDSIIHLMRGQFFTIDDKKIFTLGGAASIDKEHRIPYVSWWPEEVPNTSELREAFFNIYKNDCKADYILTHDCSDTILNNLDIYKYEFIEDNGLKDIFQIIENKCEFSHWYFGHHHLDKKIDNKHTALYEKIIKL